MQSKHNKMFNFWLYNEHFSQALKDSLKEPKECISLSSFKTHLKAAKRGSLSTFKLYYLSYRDKRQLKCINVEFKTVFKPPFISS